MHAVNVALCWGALQDCCRSANEQNDACPKPYSNHLAVSINWASCLWVPLESEALLSGVYMRARDIWKLPSALLFMPHKPYM